MQGKGVHWVTENLKKMLPIPEKRTLQGDFPARVENIQGDPRNAKRVQVRVIGLFPESIPVKSLPWATYRLPVGARVNEGSFIPVQAGDMVWVDFPFNGDTRRPRITGGMHLWPDDELNLPHETFGGPDSYEHQRTGSEPVPAPIDQETDCVFTVHDCMVEICQDRSIRITQKESGTSLEITQDGHVTIHGEQDIFITAQNLTAEVAGDVNVTSEIVNVDADSVSVEANSVNVDSGTCEVNSIQTVLTGGTVQISGAVAPTGGGSLCGLPNCLFTGAPQTGPIATGT